MGQVYGLPQLGCADLCSAASTYDRSTGASVVSALDQLLEEVA